MGMVGITFPWQLITSKFKVLIGVQVILSCLSGVIGAEIGAINRNYFEYPSEIGFRYQVQRSGDLEVWENVGPAVAGRDGLARHRIQKRAGDTHFYRVVQSPVEDKLDFQWKESVIAGSESDSAALKSYNPATGEVTFEPGADMPERSGDGSIIVIPGAEGSHGVMARIESRSVANDGSVTLNTSSVTIADLVETADIHTTRALLPEQVVSAQILVQPQPDSPIPTPQRLSMRQGETSELSDHLSVESEGYGFELEIEDLVLYESEDGENRLTLDGLLVIESPQFELDFERDRLSIEEFGLYIVHTATAQLELTGDLRLADEYRKELLKITFSTIEIGPLIFTPTLTVYVGYEYDVNGNLLVFVDQQTSAKAGVRYTPETDWEPVRELYVETPDFFVDLEATAEARAYAGVAFEFLLYGLVGPYVGAESYASFSADYSKFGTDDPWWSMSAGYGLVLGVDTDLFGFGKDFSVDLAQRQETILESGLYSRETTDIDSGNQEPEFWSMIYGGEFNEQVRAIAGSESGDSLLVGDTTTFVDSPGRKQVGFVVSSDSSGNINWQRSFGHQFSVLTTGDIISPDETGDGFLVIGSATTGKSFVADNFLTSVSSDGTFTDSLLVAVSGGGSNARTVDANGARVVIGGRTQLGNAWSSSNGWNAMIHTRDNAEDGSRDFKSWELRLSGDNELVLAEVVKVHLSPDGSSVILIKAESGAGDDDDLVVVRLNPERQPVWAKRILSPSDGFSGDMAQLNDGSIVVQSSGFVACLSGDGALLWSRHLRAWLNSVSTDGERILLAGGSMQFPVSAVLAGLTPDGEIDFSRKYIWPDRKISSALDVAAAPDGGFIIAAENQDLYRDAWIIKTLDEGSIAFDSQSGFDSDFASLNMSHPDTSVSSVDVELIQHVSTTTAWDLETRDIETTPEYIHQSE